MSTPAPGSAGEVCPGFELPLDRPRPANRDGSEASVPIEVSASLAVRLLEMEDGVTGLMAALVVLLYRCTSDANVLVEMDAILADQPGIRVALSVTASDTFRSVIEAVRDSIDAPPSKGCEPAAVRISWRAASEALGSHDLLLRLEDGADGRIRGQLLVANDVFDVRSAERLARLYLRLLGEMTLAPDRPVGELVVLAKEEAQTIGALNGRRIATRDHLVHELVAAQAARTPHAVAVRGETSTINYSELESRARRLAARLRRAGVGPELTVGICMPRCEQMVVALLAVLKAGGAYVPVDPDDPPARRVNILDDAHARVLLCVGSVPEGLPAGLATIDLDAPYDNRDDETAEGQDWAPAISSSVAAYLLYTSGTTGRPKGVVVEHRQVVSYLFAMIDRLGIDRPLRFALVQPLTVDSSVTAIVLALCTGGELHVIGRERSLDAGAMADWAQQWGMDVLKIAPQHLRALQASSRFAELLPNRFLIVGGEASGWSWLRDLQRSSPDVTVINHYGPTETTVGVLTLAVADHLDADWTTSPIGFPLAGTQASIVDFAGREMPLGAAGELVIAGGNVARGYHLDPERTAAAFSVVATGRAYRTGDRARRLADGCIAFLGRRDDQVKVRGFRIALGEIEAAVASHPAVGHAVVVVRPGRKRTSRIVACVEPAEGWAIDQNAVIRHLRERVATHMVPHRFVVTASLPRTPHGKVDRRAVELLADAETTVATKAQQHDVNAFERLVAELWAELLEVPQVETTQSFFDLGGYSLLMVELQSRLSAAIGREVDLLGLFQYPTVRAQAALLAKPGEQRAPVSRTGPGVREAALERHRQRQMRRGGTSR